MGKAIQIYGRLRSHFGNQGWWPLASKAGKTGYDWLGYRKIGSVIPKADSEMLEVCIGAILTQNTSWKNVQKALAALKGWGLIDAKKIAAVKTDKLASIIKSSGYYNQKARKLKVFAQHVLGNYGGSLKRMFAKNAPELRNELLTLHGIGPETADSISLYAAGKPSFVIDAYTKRVFSRLGISSESSGYDELQQLFAKNLPKDVELYRQYHALIVELGKNVCKKEPLCASCPLKRHCNYYKFLKQKVV